MIEYEDMCVGCPPELGCLGAGCPNKAVPVPYCDFCNNIADYIYYGEYYCDDCMRAVLRDGFSQLSTNEMLEAMEAEWATVE